MTVTSAGRSTGTDKNASNGARDAQRKDRQQAVEAAILTIEKQFGQGSIMRLGSDERQQIESIPTGSIALDLALGVGGVPRGRITEIFGPESSGKTTVCQHVLAEAQKLGGVVAFIDVEHALDPQYARSCGVDVDNLLVSQPDTGEQALEITETLIRSGGIDCVVVDSVAALVPRAEIEGEMGDSFVGIQARLMSQALRKLTGIVSRSNTALVFTNQLREKIGVMFGNPETTPGGRALKFYSSVRLDIRRIETITTGSEAIGIRCPRQGREEQGRGALPRGRVRRHVRHRHLARGRPPRRRRGLGRRAQVRRLVHLRRDAPRARAASSPRSSCAPTRTSPSSSRRRSAPRWPPSTCRWRASKRPSR